MGMSAGGGGSSLNNDINVTPMIDVLLVLLIIFMMIIPMSRKAIETQLPDPNPVTAPPDTPPDQIVLEVRPDGKFAINNNEVAKDALFNRLKEIFDPRPSKVMFVKGTLTRLTCSSRRTNPIGASAVLLVKRSTS